MPGKCGHILLTGHRSVDSFASIDIKTLQKSPSVGLKPPPPKFKQTYNDNKFTNLLNARKAPPFVLHLTLWQIYNLLLLILCQDAF